MKNILNLFLISSLAIATIETAQAQQPVGKDSVPVGQDSVPVGTNSNPIGQGASPTNALAQTEFLRLTA